MKEGRIQGSRNGVPASSLQSGDSTMAYHVSKARFAGLVERALDSLPPQFAAALEEVPVEIRPASTPAQRRRAGVGRDDLLLGLYQGIPRTQRSVEHSGNLPDVIYVFQEDVELAVDDEQDLVEQVRITVLHELGHHFGMDEDDLEELGYG
jgi:predicted Zn-dependent protease with MMP-like domain